VQKLSETIRTYLSFDIIGDNTPFEGLMVETLQICGSFISGKALPSGKLTKKY
jgi:hypothetical protein